MFTITAGQSLSNAQELRGNTLIGLQFTAAGWTSATIAFVGSPDGVNYGPVYDNAGNELTITVPTFVTNMIITLPAITLAAIRKLRWLQLQSGSHASAVIQITTMNITPVVGAGEP